jgi:hypothetical protein
MATYRRFRCPGPRPRRSDTSVALAVITVAALSSPAPALAASEACAVVVAKVEHEIFLWPRCFAAGGLRQTAQLHLRAAVRAALNGDQSLCWEHLALSGYKLACTVSEARVTPPTSVGPDTGCAAC